MIEAVALATDWSSTEQLQIKTETVEQMHPPSCGRHRKSSRWTSTLFINSVLSSRFESPVQYPQCSHILAEPKLLARDIFRPLRLFRAPGTPTA